jgi:hypothetical protein
MGFYLIDLFQLKLICWSDRCLVLDHSQVLAPTETETVLELILKVQNFQAGMIVIANDLKLKSVVHTTKHTINSIILYFVLHIK